MKRAQGQPPIRVLVCRIEAEPVVEEIDTGLDAMQKLVGGYIAVLGLDADVDLWYNEEGYGLPLNRQFAARAPEVPEGFDFVIAMDDNLAAPGEMGVHVLRGDFFLARHDDKGGTTSLTDGDIEKYREMFALERSACKEGEHGI
jgi:hypothetical protein